MLQEYFPSCKNINNVFLIKKNSAQLSLIKTTNVVCVCIILLVSFLKFQTLD